MAETMDYIDGEKKMMTGKTIVAGAIGGVLVLAGIVTLCCFNRKKRRMEKIEMDEMTNE